MRAQTNHTYKQANTLKQLHYTLILTLIACGFMCPFLLTVIELHETPGTMNIRHATPLCVPSPKTGLNFTGLLFTYLYRSGC